MGILTSLKNGASAAKMPLIFLAITAISMIFMYLIPALGPVTLVLTALSLLAYIAIGSFGAKAGVSLFEAILTSASAALVMGIVFAGPLLVSVASGGSVLVTALYAFFGVGGIIFCCVLTAVGYFMGSLFKKK